MWRWFAAVLAWLVPWAAHADGIVLYGNSLQPPKAWLDGTTPRGFVVDAAALALQRAGYSVEIRLVPFQRGMDAVKTEGVMTGIFWSAERAKLYDFSDPLVPDDITLAVRKGSTITINSPDDLTGKRVGVQEGMYYGPEFDKVRDRVTLDIDTNPALRIKKLVADRIDVLLMNPGRASVISAEVQAGVAADDVIILPHPLSQLQNHLILGKGRADGAEILQRVNQAIAALQAEGAFRPIMVRYDQ